MWKLPDNIKNAIDDSEFKITSERLDSYYSDHSNRWRILVNYIEEVMSTSVLKAALEKASATTVYGDTSITLTWKPVYPYDRSDSRWDAGDMLEYEDYETTMNVFISGFDNNYTIQVGFSVHNDADILIKTSDILPLSEKGKVVIPDWWLKEIEKIVKSVVEKPVEGKKSGILSKFWRK